MRVCYGACSGNLSKFYQILSTFLTKDIWKCRLLSISLTQMNNDNVVSYEYHSLNTYSEKYVYARQSLLIV